MAPYPRHHPSCLSQRRCPSKGAGPMAVTPGLHAEQMQPRAKGAALCPHPRGLSQCPPAGALEGGHIPCQASHLGHI